MTGLNNAARDDRPFHFCSSAAPTTPELYIGIAINGDYQNTDADSEMGTGTESDRSASQTASGPNYTVSAAAAAASFYSLSRRT